GGSPRGRTKPGRSYSAATVCSSRARATVRGNCSRLMSSSGRPLALAVARARSISAISSGVQETSHDDVSRLSVSPRQALGPLIGFVQIELIGDDLLGSWCPTCGGQ